MFQPKTLFVVGAGASKEARLPIGSELAETISDILRLKFNRWGELERGRSSIAYAFKSYFKATDVLESHLRAAKQISDGLYLANSIDNYIHIHRNNACVAACGKAAIIYSILEAERKSALYVGDQPGLTILDPRKLGDTWYVEFAKILFEQVSKDRVEDVFSDISIICFNYDRCIEYFLAHAMASLYAMPLNQAEDLVSKLSILHPYGTVGRMAFGSTTDSLNLFEVSKSIKTYTEQVEDKKIIGDIRNVVDWAETIVFLGFAFNPQNMSILKPIQDSVGKRIFATAKGLSNDAAQIVGGNIHRLLRLQSPYLVVRNDFTCCDLFREYGRSLARD